MSKNGYGRQTVFTEYLTSTLAHPTDTLVIKSKEDMKKVFEAAQPAIEMNMRETTALFDFYKGKHSILERVKTIRPEINHRKTINLQMSATRNIVGYTFSKPVTYVSRKGASDKNIENLNNYMEMLGKPSLDKNKAEDSSICGTSYISILPSASVRGANEDIPFSMLKLDPRYTEVVYYNENDKLPIFAVAYGREDTSRLPSNPLSSRVINIYTRENIYTGTVGIAGSVEITRETPNTLGMIPIVEYPNNQYKIGDWETCTDIIDALELALNDNLNSIEQFVSSILVLLGAELPKKTITEKRLVIEEQEDGTEKEYYVDETIETTDIEALKGGILELISEQDGTKLDAKYLSREIDNNTINTITEILNSIFSIVVGLPDRKTNSDSGGDTGAAVTNRDGWRELENVALIKEDEYRRAEYQLLGIIKKCYSIKNKDTGFDVSQIEVKFSRNKNDNLTNKVNALATLINSGIISPIDALNIVDMSNNNIDIVKRGEEYVAKKTAEAQELMAKQATNTPPTDKNGENVPKNEPEVE